MSLRLTASAKRLLLLPLLAVLALGPLVLAGHGSGLRLLRVVLLALDGAVAPLLRRAERGHTDTGERCRLDREVVDEAADVHRLGGSERHHLFERTDRGL